MKKYVYTTFLIAVLYACNNADVPRPYGYFRIDIPDFEYRTWHKKDYPYSFEVSNNAQIAAHKQDGENFWVDLIYPQFNAKIHCTYKNIHSRKELHALSDDCLQFVYNHVSKANAIPEKEFCNDSLRIYGLFFELKGNTASPIQLFMTDSTRHFFRGAVYIESIPNYDSLKPVIDYLLEDSKHIMETFQWEK